MACNPAECREGFGMNFWEWLKTQFSNPKPTYDPEDDTLVQELKSVAATSRRRAAELRFARMNGQVHSFEELWGREYPHEEGQP